MHDWKCDWALTWHRCWCNIVNHVSVMCSIGWWDPLPLNRYLRIYHYRESRSSWMVWTILCGSHSGVLDTYYKRSSLSGSGLPYWCEALDVVHLNNVSHWILLGHIYNYIFQRCKPKGAYHFTLKTFISTCFGDVEEKVHLFTQEPMAQWKELLRDRGKKLKGVYHLHWIGHGSIYLWYV